MKRLFFIALCILSIPTYADKITHSLKFKINNLTDSVCYLGGYYGPKQYYRDTAIVKANGTFSFEGSDSLQGGIYSVILQDKKTYFEFIVNEQNFFMETDTLHFVNYMKVKGSVENTLFYDYLKFIEKKQEEVKPLKPLMDKLKENEDSLKIVRAQLQAIDKEVKDYKKNFMKEHPDAFLTKIFMTSEDPEVPDAPKSENGEEDKDFAFKYFKSHYFDGVDFSDGRLLRTPVLHNKIEYYMKKLTVQMPDSINVSADYLAEKARANKEIFKYVVHYVTNNYEKSKIMGMDAVFVHMAETYYMKGDAYWMDSTNLAKVEERAMKLKPLLVGKKTVNLILQDTTEKNWVSLYDVKAKYTVLYFWDPDCGHCKKETPKLLEVYEEFKDKGLEVYAVGTELETKDWKKFIIEHKLNWINVSDNTEINKNAMKYIHLTTIESLNFRDTYDIYSTPVLYLLDENKKILAKRIDSEQVKEILEKELSIEKEDLGEKVKE